MENTNHIEQSQSVDVSEFTTLKLEVHYIKDKIDQLFKMFESSDRKMTEAINKQHPECVNNTKKINDFERKQTLFWEKFDGEKEKNQEQQFRINQMEMQIQNYIDSTRSNKDWFFKTLIGGFLGIFTTGLGFVLYFGLKQALSQS